MPDINGIPYVESDDLVSAYPAASQALAQEVSDQLASKLDAGAGRVLQVLSTTKTDTFTTTSTSFVDVTGLSVSITPTSATNKIMVFATISGSNDPTVGAMHAQLLRDSTAIAIGDSAGVRIRGTSGMTTGGSDTNAHVTMSANHLDSPATTSATTYKVQIMASAGTAYVNRSDGDPDSSVSVRTISTITVMEVAA